jgi:hypothetical protein
MQQKKRRMKLGGPRVGLQALFVRRVMAEAPKLL